MSGVTDGYRDIGVAAYYKKNAATYTNPHHEYVAAAIDSMDFSNSNVVLDVGCGDGIITKLLRRKRPVECIGIDGYMADRYMGETGCMALSMSFEELATNGINVSADDAICSYMVDLIPLSYRHNFFWQLAQRCNRIITIRPVKHDLTFGFMSLEYSDTFGKANIKAYRTII